MCYITLRGKSFESLLDKYPVEKIQADRGSEFRNALVMAMTKRKGTHLFFTNDQTIKASIVERFNRTLKSKMYKYFTLRGRKNWVEMLPQLLLNYNNSVNRAIGMPPSNVNQQNIRKVFKTLYPGFQNERQILRQTLLRSTAQAKFKPGDVVKLAYELKPFEHRYYPNYSDRYYIVASIVKGYPFIKYKLRYFEINKLLAGSFHEQQLQQVTENEYRLEKVAERTVRGRKQIKVHYLGYPESFDEWRYESEIRSLSQ